MRRNSIINGKQAGDRGFTLLLAALVSSIVLALGIAIFQIAFKQVSLSTIGRDSQFAFYAADTGAECALYWDIRQNFFGTSTPAVNAYCGGGPQPLVVSGRSGVYPYTMDFEFEANGYCTQVAVVKSLRARSSSAESCSAVSATQGGAVCTVIHADGYSTSCLPLSGDTSASRILQRSVELHY